MQDTDILSQVTKDGHKPITTQIFDSQSKYLEDDSVFAVKDDLVVKFEPRRGDPQAEWELQYDIALAKDDAKGVANHSSAIPAQL